jgi:hypothetical protein
MLVVSIYVGSFVIFNQIIINFVITFSSGLVPMGSKYRSSIWYLGVISKGVVFGTYRY